MTPGDVRKRVKAIRAISHKIAGDEDAHIAEDALHHDVLQAIADNTAINPSECAREALKTKNIDFQRWCS